MSLISVTNLTFAYEGSYDNVFENVSFQIDTDWKLGFIGRNGRGKTTFLNLLPGKLAYSGNISASVKFEYFPYVVADKELDTLEVIRSAAGDIEEWRLFKEMNQLELSEDVLYRPFSTLSNGEQSKMLLAALFLKENSFLLIDEPTNHLDVSARGLVSDYLGTKKGFILVSHDRAFLDNCIDHVLSINRMNIEIQRGNFSSWYRNKELQDSFEIAENDRLKKDISRLKDAARRTSEWSDKAERSKIGFDPSKTEKNINRRPLESAKSKKLMSRSKSITERQQGSIEEKSKLLKNIEQSESLKLNPLKYHAKQLAELRDVSIFYGDKRACSGLSFTIEQGDRIALCGKNGSGKTSIIKLLCGEPVSYTGALHIGSQLKISYVPQEAPAFCGKLTDYAEQNGIEESLFKAILRKLDFSRTQFEKNMSDFSSGQKKKVLIAKSLCEQAHLYLWDEPLNYIDVISRIQIEELLLEYKPTILFVEHDRTFCENIATKFVTCK